MKQIFLLSLTILFLTSCYTGVDKNKYESKVLLHSVTENTLGNKIHFPDSNATITSAIRVIPAGESTGIHMHEAIPVVYMIDGEITINHETENGLVTTVVKKGESFVGATNNWHDTKVTSESDAVAYVVFIGAKDLKNSILEKYSQFSVIKNKKFIDKSLENIFNIEFIKNIYPEAKFIHTFRNPLDSIISIYQSMLPDLSWTHTIEDIIVYMDNYYKVLKHFKSKYPEIIMDINLEEFTEKSEELTKKMFKFCGLTWNKNILNFYMRKNLYSKTLSFNQIRSKVLKYNNKKYQPYFNLINEYKDKYEWLNQN